MILKTQNRTYFLEIQDILHIESNNTYSKLYLRNNNKIVTAKLLSYFEKLLSTDFVRINRSHLINRSIIKEASFASSTILLINGEVHSISRRRKKMVQQLIG